MNTKFNFEGNGVQFKYFLVPLFNHYLFVYSNISSALATMGKWVK